MLNQFKLTSMAVAVSALVGCASGGGSSAPTIAPITSSGSTPPASTDARYKFDDIVQTFTPNVSGYSDTIKVTSRVTPEKTTGLPAPTEKYKITDYGFLQVVVDGHHAGYEAGEESSKNNTFIQNGMVYRSDINNDGHEDFYVFNFIGEHDELEYRPDSLVYAFINDGNGHFELDNSVFGDDICLKGSSEHCINSHGHGAPIVADFNGDGMDDIFRGAGLFLSDNGKLFNKSSNLPADMYESCWQSECWWHRNSVGDADGDNDLDIFLPHWGHTVNNQPMVWSMLVNDGSGNFVNNQNFPSEMARYFATAAVVADFDNDGHGDVAVGWFKPGQNPYTTVYENSAGLVFFNDGNNDWRNRPWVELPDNYYGTNGNANDLKAFDFDGDGYTDIVFASTKHDPYYNGRMIQFFKNNGGTSFTDVTGSGNDKYANGLSNGYWNGDGHMEILDFDHDGDLDVVDVVQNTYVLLNDGNGNFELYDDFPRFGSGRYYPVEIDGKYWYDFIGATQETNGTDQSTMTYYQVLDPPATGEYIVPERNNPFIEMMLDITTKPEGYVNDIFDTVYLMEDMRYLTNGSKLFGKTINSSRMFGFNIEGDQYSMSGGNIWGNVDGFFLGTDYTLGKIRFGVNYMSGILQGKNETSFFGTGTADIDFDTTNLFAETQFTITDNIFLSVGSELLYTDVESFDETNSLYNTDVNSFDMTVYKSFTDLNAVYQSNLGTTYFMAGVDYYKTLDTTEVKFNNSILSYDYDTEEVVGKFNVLHQYKGMYFKASMNSKGNESYELGFTLKF